MMIIARKMLEENNLCVLATCNDNLPNSSLMQYIYDDVDMSIYMLTLGGSLKYNNIIANPQVSLLIDTRSDVNQAGLPIMALTVFGRATIVNDPQKQQAIIEKLVAKNNRLAVLTKESLCLVIQMKIERMLLLEGVNNKSSIDIKD